MAKARAIDIRRKAVGNIKKITHTMQLIATARYQKSLATAVGTKPYTEKITELVQQVSAAGGQVDHPLLNTNPDTTRQAVLLLASNRGLCGGYNASVIRKSMVVMNANRDAGVETDLLVIGKKGVNYFKFLGMEMHQTFPDMPDAPSFEDIEPIATGFMERYEAGYYAKVTIVYTRFISAAKQIAESVQLLPIQKETSASDDSSGTDASEMQFDFSPPPDVLLAELLPVTVKIRLLQCVNDAVVSENVSRMVAMKSATDAASDMGKLLAQQFNRARQSQITMELLDIMGGVEALK
jgi:F-type H+-transporting ATPase subunit gamma